MLLMPCQLARQYPERRIIMINELFIDVKDRMNALNARFDNYQPTQNYNQQGLGLFT